MVKLLDLWKRGTIIVGAFVVMVVLIIALMVSNDIKSNRIKTLEVLIKTGGTMERQMELLKCEEDLESANNVIEDLVRHNNFLYSKVDPEDLKAKVWP